MHYIDLTRDGNLYYDDGEYEYTRVSFDASDHSAPDCINCGLPVQDGYVDTSDKTAAICDGCAIVHDPENPYNL